MPQLKNVVGTMNQSVKKLWIKALETGRLPNGKKIHQGKRWLCTRNEKGKRDLHCCLGVLEEIYAIKNPTLATSFIKNNIKTFNSEEKILSDKTAIWAGLDENDPPLYFPKQDITCSASCANDGESYWNDEHQIHVQVPRKTFKKIAEAIRISW